VCAPKREREREREYEDDEMGSSSRHRARRFVPKHDVQEVIENLSHKNSPPMTSTSSSSLGNINNNKNNNEKTTTVNAIDAFQKQRQREQEQEEKLRAAALAEEMPRSSTDASSTSSSEAFGKDIEAACASRIELEERKALAPLEAGKGITSEEDANLQKIKETKRRSERCYGCSSCEYYCSLKECEFCASMLVFASSRRDRGRTKRRATTEKTNGKHHRSSQHYTCCDIDRLRKHAREREGEEDEKVWLVAHGNVYEASAFVQFHPAGRAVMMKGAGRDNSEDFDMHSKRAREVWRELRVGELVQCPEKGFGGYQPKPGFSVEQCTIM